MALSKILENSISDGAVAAAKLKDFSAAVDLNGVELILDADQDTSITADTDDRIDFKIANVEHFSFSNSSGDTVVKPMVDAKDIIFQQYDGNKLFEINDGNFVSVGGNSAAGGEIRIYEDTDLGTNYTGFKAGNLTSSVAYQLPLTDAASSGQALTSNSSGVLSWSTISTAYDDLTAGDAAINLTTTAGNITIDAQGNDTDIIFKGTDGGADRTFMTIDGSAGGDLFLTGGLIDLKNDGSAVSQIKFYCESSNAHAQTLQGAPHSESATNALTLPSTGGSADLVSTSSSSNLTNKTLTSPIINTGTFGTSILPTSADGTTLGSASKEFSDLFLADASTIQFGNDQDVTLTHVADTGLLLNAAMKIQFRDSAIHISSTADGDLAIAADDEIDITSTLIDINGNVEISGTAVTTGVHTFTAVPVFPNNTVESADIQADAITGAKIADDAIDSEHYTDGSIDTAHIAADQIVASLIADNAIDSEHYTDGSIDAAHLASNAVTTAKINTAAVTSSKIANDNIDSQHYAADSIDTEHYAAGSVDATALASNAVTEAKINSGAVTNAKLGADSVNGSKIADDAINSEHYTDGSIDTAHIADGQVTIGKLATAVLTGATDIGAAIVDADLFLIDDGAGGTLRKTTAARIKTYAGGAAAMNDLSDVHMDITNLTNGIIIQTQRDGGAPNTGTLNNATGILGIGENVFGDLTAGDDMVALGNNALATVTSGSANIAIGSNTLDSITTENYNIAIGYNAIATGDVNGGEYNIAMGHGALTDLTTGDKNVIIGHNAGANLTTGVGNVHIGYEAGLSDDVGDNIFIGNTAGRSVNSDGTGGQSNIFIGRGAGYDTNACTGGRWNVIIGYDSRGTGGNHEGEIVLGYNVESGAENRFTFGVSGTDSAINHGETSISAPSDIRLKESVNDCTAGLSFINDLRPVTYMWRKEKDIPEEMRTHVPDSEERFNNDKVNHGFIAQEVKEAIDNHPELKNGFTMWKEDIQDGRQRIGESALVPMLVTAIQELSAKIDAQQIEITELKGE